MKWDLCGRITKFVEKLSLTMAKKVSQTYLDKVIMNLFAFYSYNYVRLY